MMVEGQRYPRQLPVRLTAEEREDYAKQLAGMVGEREKVEASKDAAGKEFGRQLKHLEFTTSRIAHALRAGEVMREVTCQEEMDYGAAEVRLVRLDTLDVVERRTMTADERQAALAFPSRRSRETVSETKGE